MVRYGAVVVEAWIWHRSKPSRIKAEDSSEMIDTSPTSRGGATAYLSSGRWWRVWHHHMHRTHGAKAGLVLQGVGIGIHVDVAVTLAATITMN